MHGGHTNRPSDLAWAPVGHKGSVGGGATELGMDWFMASCAEDNVVQVWRVGDSVWAGERRQVDMEDLE